MYRTRQSSTIRHPVPETGIENIVKDARSDCKMVTSKRDAALVLQLNDAGGLQFRWRGFKRYRSITPAPVECLPYTIPVGMSFPPISTPKWKEIRRILSLAARFHHILSTPPPTFRPFPIEVELCEMVDNDGKWEFVGADLPSRSVGHDRRVRSIDLKIEEYGSRYIGFKFLNKADFPLWPYVLAFDPDEFVIGAYFVKLTG